MKPRDIIGHPRPNWQEGDPKTGCDIVPVWDSIKDCDGGTVAWNFLRETWGTGGEHGPSWRPPRLVVGSLILATPAAPQALRGMLTGNVICQPGKVKPQNGDHPAASLCFCCSPD